MLKLSHNVSVASAANNPVAGHSMKLHMKTRIASCVCAAAMLLLAPPFASMGYTQSSAEQPLAAESTAISDPAKVYLTNDSVLNGVQILQIDEEYIVLRIPGKERDEAYRVTEIDKILFAQGQEHSEGIVRKDGQQIYGTVTYRRGLWRIAQEDSGYLTLEGEGNTHFRSISFRNCCKRPISEPPRVGIKKEGAQVRFIFDGTPLDLKPIDTSLAWNPLTIPGQHGVLRQKQAEATWTGYWYAPKSGQYVFTVMSYCFFHAECFQASISIGGQSIYRAGGTGKDGQQKVIDLKEGYHRIEVHIIISKQQQERRVDQFALTAQIDGQAEKEQITPARLYHD